VGGSYGPLNGNENARYHSVDVREALFKHVEVALDPTHLLSRPTLEAGVVGMYTLNNLVTRRQADYSEIMQEKLGGSPRGVTNNCRIDSNSFGCYTLAKLMAFRENLQHFTPEFRENLQDITSVLDELIIEKMNIHRSPEFVKEKAVPVIKELIQDDKRGMTWYAIAEDSKQVCFNSTITILD
jgi:hypothetical protein